MLATWITIDDLDATADPELAQWAADVSTWLLWKLTAEKYSGTRISTEMYSIDGLGSNSYEPNLVGGEMYNLPASYRLNAGTSNIRLRRTPVLSIVSVVVNGDEIDANEYQLRNNAYIVRRNKMPWILDPMNELEITYIHGTPPPSMGKAAAVRFANELIWNEMDDERCTLPERISSSVTRQGVSYTILDPMDFIKEGRTGIPMVDMFISAANPNKAKKKPKVFSPDKPRGERIN